MTQADTLRSSAAKATKGGHDADYKAILDVFIGDLLSVLYRPEWPAAALYLLVVSKTMVSYHIRFLYTQLTHHRSLRCRMLKLETKLLMPR